MRILLAAWLGTAAAWTAAPRLGSSRQTAGASSSSTRRAMQPSMLLEEAQGPEALLRLCAAARSKCCLDSARARFLCLLRARLVALGGSALPGRGHATASAARPSRLQGRRVPCLAHPGAATDRGQRCTSAERALIASLVRDMEGDAPRADATMLNGNWRLLYPQP